MSSNDDKTHRDNISTSRASRKRSVTHPRNTLKQAEELARIVYEEGPRRCDQDLIAKKVGFSGANNGSFAALKATAVQFGMITTDSQTISLVDHWIELFLNEDQQGLRLARQNAMHQPYLYKLLIEDFSDRQLPAVEKLTQQLYVNSKYGILRDAAGVAAKVFFESASYANILNDRNFIQSLDRASDTTMERNDTDREDGFREKSSSVSQESHTRQVGYDKRDSGSLSPLPPALAELFKVDIPLENDLVMYIYGPRRLPYGEKERIKRYIDLWLEEQPNTTHQHDEQYRQTSDALDTDDWRTD